VLLFAAMDDKDIDSMAAELGSRATEVVVTRVPGSDRTAEPETLRAIFGKYTEKIVVEEDSKAALTGLLQRVTDDTALVVCGSMYLVGQAREFLRVHGSGS
jgi:dihydrofolate synthase/folylpolyglutamate synthase